MNRLSTARFAFERAPLCLLVLGFLALALACQSPEERSIQAYDAALAALAASDLPETRRAVSLLIAVEDTSAEHAVRAADILAKSGQAGDAVYILEDGVARYPDRVDLKLGLARVALLVHDPATALRAIEGVSEASDYYASVLEERGKALLALGRLEQALAVFEESQRKFPGAFRSRLTLVATLMQERRHRDAVAILEAMIREARGEGADELAHYLEPMSAKVLHAAGDSDRAVALMRERVTVEPTDVDAWLTLISILREKDGPAAVIAEVEAGITAHPDVSALLMLKGSVYEQAGDEKAAEAAYIAYVDEAWAPEAVLALCNLYFRQQRHDLALPYLSEAVRRHPHLAHLRTARAEALIALARIDEAEEEIAELRRASSTDPRADFLAARILLAQGDAAGAVRALRELAPRYDVPSTHFWLGLALEDAGELDAAMRRHGMAVLGDSSELAYHIAMVRVSERQGNWVNVRGFAERTLRLFPRTEPVYHVWIESLLELGHPEMIPGAAELYEQVFGPGLNPALFRARGLRAQGTLAEARTTLEAARSQYGGSPEVDAELALLIATTGEPQAGLAAAVEARRAYPGSPTVYLAFAVLQFQAGASEEGSRAIDRVLELAPHDPGPLLTRAGYYASRGEVGRAKADYERYLVARPGDADALTAFGSLLAASGQTLESIAVLRQAAEADDRSYVSRNNLAWLLHGQGDLDGALEVAQEAYRIAGTDAQVIDTLGWLYLQKGLVDRAIALLEAARVSAPDLADPQLHLAQAYSAAGRRAEARDLLIGLESRDDLGRKMRADVATSLAALEEPGMMDGHRVFSLSRVLAAGLLGLQVAACGDGAVVPRAEIVETMRARTQRPHVVLILVDTLRGDWARPVGGDGAMNPEIARWAARGVTFERNLAQSSWTKIAMASMMTSRWPHSHDVIAIKSGLADRAVTLAEVLHDSGYATHGVQSNGWLEQSFGFSQGFDSYQFPKGEGGIGMSRAELWPHGDRVYAAAEKVIEAHDEARPLFLYVHMMDVHDYAAPLEFRKFGNDSEGIYRAAILWTDDVARRVREALERRGMLDDAILVYTADHGEAFGEQDKYGHARNLYTQVLSVPLVFRMPFRVEPTVVPTQVRNIDVAPTLLDLARIEIPDEFEGESLAPLFERADDSPAPDRTNFAELGDRLFKDADPQMSTTDGRWTLIRRKDGSESLFDRSVDPAENVDLIAIEQTQAQRMRGLLDEYLAANESKNVEDDDVRIDPDIANRLRAMGYLQDEPIPEAAAEAPAKTHEE